MEKLRPREVDQFFQGHRTIGESYHTVASSRARKARYSKRPEETCSWHVRTVASCRCALMPCGDTEQSTAWASGNTCQVGLLLTASWPPSAAQSPGTGGWVGGDVSSGVLSCFPILTSVGPWLSPRKPKSHFKAVTAPVPLLGTIVTWRARSLHWTRVQKKLSNTCPSYSAAYKDSLCPSSCNPPNNPVW